MAMLHKKSTKIPPLENFYKLVPPKNKFLKYNLIINIFQKVWHAGLRHKCTCHNSSFSSSWHFLWFSIERLYKNILSMLGFFKAPLSVLLFFCRTLWSSQCYPGIETRTRSPKLLEKFSDTLIWKYQETSSSKRNFLFSRNFKTWVMSVSIFYLR